MRIAVIGGGIAGISAADSLAESADVTLLEAEASLATHASGRSAAMFEENYGSAPIRALNGASRDVLNEFGVLGRRGFLMVGNAEEEDAFAADLEALSLPEIPVSEARTMVPILADTITRAAFHGDAFDIDTDLLVQSFAASARAKGAQVLTSARVEAIGGSGPFTLATTKGAITADIVVNAAGAWADVVAELAGVRPVGLTPFRRSMARMKAPGGHDVRNWPMLYGPGESWYAKPDAGGWIVSPADEDPCPPMDAWADDMVIAEGLARYEAHVTVPVTHLTTTWAGLRTFAPDRAMVIGEAPDMPGFFWLAGQGGYGVQSSPAAARLLADLCLSRSPALGADVVAAFDPARFRA